MKKITLLSCLISCAVFLFAQKNATTLSAEDKIFGLSKVWKEADKNFVFFDHIPSLNWDQAYQEYIPKVLATQNTYEYYKVLQKFCSLLNDGHTRVIVPWELRKNLEVAPALKTELIDNKVIITEIQNDTLKEAGITIGMEIVEINGKEVHQHALQNIKPYVFYSTKQDMEVQVYEYNLLLGPIDQPLVIKSKNGKVFTISRKLKKNTKEDPIFEFKVLQDGIGYLKITRFWGENFETEFDSIYPRIGTTTKLIIDVSENQGGNSNNSHYVLSHFVQKPFETSRWKTLMYMPAYASWGYNTQWQDNNGDLVQPVDAALRYTKPVLVLMSEKTYSAAEDFVSAFLNTGIGKVIGRSSAGTTGNPIGFALPGNGGFQICSKRDYMANGKEFVGFGIEPSQVVKKTTDKNHLLNAALETFK